MKGKASEYLELGMWVKIEKKVIEIKGLSRLKPLIFITLDVFLKYLTPFFIVYILTSQQPFR